MKMGRDSGRYVPSRTVSGVGAIGPSPLAGFSVIDRHELQLVLVFLVVGQAHVAERILVAGDTLHENVVVLAGRVVAAADLRLAVDDLGEVVERSRVHARTEQVNFLIRPVRSHLIPSQNLSLRGRLPQLLQLRDRDRRRPGVLRIHDDRHAVVGDRQLDVVNPGLLAGLDFRRGDRPRRVGDDASRRGRTSENRRRCPSGRP